MDTKFQIKFHQLGNPNWLEEKYCKQKLSLATIAQEIGCTYTAVRSACIRHKITVRTKGEGLRNARRSGNDFFVFDKAIIEGCLLGDGGLRCENRESIDSFPIFQMGTIHYDHACWVAKQIFSQNFANRIVEGVPKNDAGDGSYNSRPIFRLTTLTHNDLIPLFRAWYPKENGFKKVIPVSIEIDEKTLLHWYLGDGYSYFVNRKKCKNPIRTRIQFATQCFQRQELETLCKKLECKFGLNMYPRFHQRNGQVKGTGYHVELSETDVQAKLFFDIIGPPPVASLAYKWKIPSKR